MGFNLGFKGLTMKYMYKLWNAERTEAVVLSVNTNAYE